MTIQSLPSQSGRRFWMTAACFIVANLLAWVVYHHAVAPSPNLLRVEHFWPGNDAIIDAGGELTWRFNLDIASAVPEDPDLARFSPAIAGNWRLVDSRTLSFVPETALPPATRFEVGFLPGRLRTPDGFTLASATPFVFKTRPLSVASVRQAGMIEQDRFIIELGFSDSVDPADLAAAMTITTAAGHEIGFRPHGGAAGRTVRVITDSLPWPQQASDERSVDTLLIRIAPPLAGQSGPLGLEVPWQTQLRLSKRLMFTTASAEYPTRNPPVIRLAANGPVDLESARRVISVDPPVEFTITDEWPGVVLRGDFAADRRYTVTIAAPPAGEEAARYPRPERFSVFMPSRQPGLWFEHTEGYLGLSGHRALQAHAVNLTSATVNVWRVYDNNLVAWRNARGNSWRWNTADFARPIATRQIDIAAEPNAVHPIHLRLEELLPADVPRHGVFRISIESNFQPDSSSRHRRTVSATAVATLSDIALTTKQASPEKGQPPQLLVWATSMHTAEPMADVRLRLYSSKNQLIGEATTAADGLARIDGAVLPEDETPSVLLAEGPDGDLTWIDLRTSRWRLADLDIAGRPWLRDGYEAFAYTDRGIYRPGDTVHLRAIVRDGQLRAPGSFPVTWRLRRPDLRDWQSRTVMLDADGSAALTVELPDELPTGQWTAMIGLPGEDEAPARWFAEATFLIEEYIPDRIRTELRFEPAGPRIPHVAAGSSTAGLPQLRITAQAEYLFGQPAADLPSSLAVRLDPVIFAPPQWRGWRFGDRAEVGVRPAGPGAVDGLATKRTSEAGVVEWEIDLDSTVPRSTPADDVRAAAYAGPWQLHAAAEVRETGGRGVTAARAAHVDRLAWYIGLRPRFVDRLSAGAPAGFDIALVRPDGAMAAIEEPQQVQVHLFREKWNNVLVHRDGRYHYQSARVLEVVENKAPPALAIEGGAAALELAGLDGGRYVLALFHPQTGALTSLGFLVTQPGGWDDNISRDNPERIELTILRPRPADAEPSWLLSALIDHSNREAAGTSRERQRAVRLLTRAARSFASDFAASRLRGSEQTPAFRPGQTALVHVQSPFAGQLLLSVETDRVLSTRVIDMPASQMLVPVEITADCFPNAYISATVIRKVDRDLAWRTHRAFGIARVMLDPADHRIDVEIDVAEQLRPNQSLDVWLRALDADGRPLADVPITLAAVDEGILQLTRFTTPDPLAFFTARRALGVRSGDLFNHLMPEVRPPDPISAVGGDREVAGADRYRSPITARRVQSLALFAGEVRTDDDGRALMSLHMPQFTGRVRLMAIAHSGSRFGSADRAVEIRSPLLVQSSFPRFVAPLDRFEVPLRIFNNTDAGGEVAVELEQTAVAAAELAQRVHIPAGGQAVVYAPLSAGEQAGIMRVTVRARLGDEIYEETTELPVRPANPQITRGGFELAEPDHDLRVTIPEGMLAGTQRVRIAVSAGATFTIPDALDWLERYPYGCTEQTISSCFPLVYLSDIGQRIAPGMFEEHRVAERVRAGVLRLLGHQRADGGLAMWMGGRESWPWASVYAAHFLVEAEAAGHEVPADFRDRLLDYVRAQVEAGGDDAAMLETQAYGAYVLALAGRPARASMARLTERARFDPAAADDRTSPGARQSARMFLSLAWLASGRRDLAGGLIPDISTIDQRQREHGGSVASGVRDSALLISTLLAVDPNHPALPELVERLAAAGNDNGWRSTQDYAFAVMALGRYLRQLGEAPPLERIEIWRDGALVAAEEGGQVLELAGGDAGDFIVRIAASTVAEEEDAAGQSPVAGQERVTISARAYVRWTQSGVPLAPTPAADHGIQIRRRYLDLDGNPLASRSAADRRNGSALPTGDLRPLTARSGELVRVELTLEAPPGLRNLVIEDLLPAGLEIENPRLATSAAAGGRQRAAGGGESDEHSTLANSPFSLLHPTRVEMRDDRLVLMADMPHHTERVRYVYLARAVSAGEFDIPPVRAEAMYDMSIRSLHGGGRLLVHRDSAAADGLAQTE